MNHTRRVDWWTTLLLLVGSCTGCGGDPDSSTPSYAGAPVILISIDTLRSDRLPAYGYEGVETPAIERLRADGILFERAYSHSPLTLPAHASLLTGLLPSEHGIRDNSGFRLSVEAVPFLTRELALSGYISGAAVSSYVLRRDSGLATGFDAFDEVPLPRTGEGPRGERSGHTTVLRALEWIGDRGREPFLFFLHLNEPHTPYQPPEPFASRYPDPYDGEIAAADDALRKFFHQLDAQGVYDRALIILLSDHGEGLGDHGEAEHGILLYREALQVPLIVKLPGSDRAGTVVPTPVQLTDISPSVRSLVGASPEKPPLFDVDEMATTPRQIYAESFYGRLHMGWSELTSIIEGDLQYIEGPKPELYDLARDPRQQNSILDTERRTGARLRRALEGFQRPLEPRTAADAETAQQLSSLGYLGSTGATPEDSAIDPKSQLEVFEEIRAAVRRLTAGETKEAAVSLRRVIADHPESSAAWEYLARALEADGQLEEAAEAYVESLRQRGSGDFLALAAARIYLRLGRWRAARDLATLVIETNPGAVHSLLAEVAMTQAYASPSEELTALMARAESHSAAARSARPESIRLPLTLAGLALHAGDVDRAARLLAAAEDVQTAAATPEQAATYSTLLGEVQARTNRPGEAEVSFLAAIEHDPEAYRAHGLLASLYAFQGDSPRAIQTLRSLVAKHPTPRAHATAIRTLRAIRQPDAANDMLRQARVLFPDEPELRGL